MATTNTPWGRYWTPDEIEDLKKYVKQNLSYVEIANKLNRTPRSVELKKINIARNMYEKCNNITEVEEAFNLSASELEEVKKPSDKETKKKIMLDEEKKEVIKEIKNHIKEIYKLMKKIDLD